MWCTQMYAWCFVEPCGCWKKEELSIETDATTNILVSSSNLCPERNQNIFPTNSYLWNSTKTIYREQVYIAK
jgi:hypothetical protein